jgi:hypothetical protein
VIYLHEIQATTYLGRDNGFKGDALPDRRCHAAHQLRFVVK